MLADTDWHIHELYDGLLADATMVRATFHRYVIDANRDPSGAESLSGPEHDRPRSRSPISMASRSGSPVPSRPPTTSRARLRDFHAPYHAALKAEIDRVKANAWHRDPLRLPFDPLRHSRSCSKASCRISTSARMTAGRCDTRIEQAVVHAICAAAEGYTQRPQRALQGRLDDAALRQAARRQSMPSRWSLTQSTHLADRGAALCL